MKRLFTLMILLLLAMSPMARAQGPDDQYINIYNLIQQADALSERGQSGPAMAKYLEAQSTLKKFQTVNPDWNAKVVKFRLNYLEGKIAQLSTNQSAPAPVKKTVNPQTNAPAPVPVPASAPTPPRATEPLESVPPPPTNAAPPAALRDMEGPMKALQEQVHRLEADKVLLEAKLKEALSAQPASVDPRELAKAEQKIRELQKENDLLKVGLENTKTNAVPQVDPAALGQARQALAEANRKLTQLSEANANLAMEKQAMQARLKTLSSSSDEAAIALRAENEILKKELAGLKSKPGAMAKDEDANRKLLQAQAQIATLQSDKDILRLEKIALENRLRHVTAMAATNAPAAIDTASLEKIRVLELQRDELQKSLDAATKELRGRKKGKETATRIDDMTRQLATLRARIDVLEAKKVPYTTEELALFNKPGSNLTATDANTGKKTHKELSPTAGKMVVEAQRYFAARQFDKAEEKYLEVLKQDSKNVFTLANLAAIQIERNQLPDAEKNAKQAIALEPNDAYTLSLLGRIQFQQANYDEALDTLSHAAQLDPQSAEIQNYLGITLSHKGLRGPAETALRKAIQIEPSYGSAHNNLAVVYVTQRPPLVELARWHYQKALAAGHPHNLELEKLLDSTKTASATSQ
ncbi:MAG: Tetratricopeptide 2 repeat protein [Pedosphaera sp.]|nr:Tetratricopeptide 2 repeat protein [Pedosphaera sp.]